MRHFVAGQRAEIVILIGAMLMVISAPFAFLPAFPQSCLLPLLKFLSCLRFYKLYANVHADELPSGQSVG